MRDGLGLFVSQVAIEVFGDGFFEVNIVDVGQCGKPSEHVGDFFFFVSLVVAGQGGG